MWEVPLLQEQITASTSMDIVIPASMPPYDIRPTRMWEVQLLLEQITASPSMDIVIPASMPPYDIQSIHGHKKREGPWPFPFNYCFLAYLTNRQIMLKNQYYLKREQLLLFQLKQQMLLCQKQQYQQGSYDRWR